MDTAHATPDSPIVLFDGVCGFCDGAVRWLLDHDRSGRLRFAPLQGTAAAELRRRHPAIPQGIDTLVYVEAGPDGERVSLRSEAVFRTLAFLDDRHWALRFRWLPRALADLGYAVFARLRYRVFGRLDQCRVPAPEERARFLV